MRAGPTIQRVPGGSKRSRLLAARVKLDSLPESPSRRVALAEAAFRLAVLPDTETDEAIQLIEDATKWDPIQPKLFFHLGRLLHTKGDTFAAVCEYIHCLQLAPGSARTLLHMSLALFELDREANELGMNLLSFLSHGDADKVADCLLRIQSWADQRADPDSRSGPTSAKTQHRAQANASLAWSWSGWGRILVLAHLRQHKSDYSRVDSILERILQDNRSATAVAEYASLCILRLLDNRPSASMVEIWLAHERVRACPNDPALSLLRNVAELAALKTPEQFANAASRKVLAGSLPPELACALHCAWYGMDDSCSPAETLNAIDLYPQGVSNVEYFRELRLLILDASARQAWARGKFDHASILWRAAVFLDPERVSLAHNLAVLATRTRSLDDYAHLWERAAETRYLFAASTGDVRININDRRTMHLTFAQQSQRRYIATEASSDQQRSAEIAAWLTDRDALKAWLEEWDLYYLNSRLTFQSPLHILGLSRDSSIAAALEAQASLLSLMNRLLRSRSWAGIQTFCALSARVIEVATAEASDEIRRQRDRFVEAEQRLANELNTESVDRGFLLFRIVRYLLDKGTASDLTVAWEIARSLLTLPWGTLERLCKAKGLIDRDTNILEVLTSHVAGLAALALPSKNVTATVYPTVEQRIRAVDHFVSLAPGRAELRQIKCQLLLEAKRNHEAYTEAVEALSLAASIADPSQAALVKRNLLSVADAAAFAELPQHLLRPDFTGYSTRGSQGWRKSLARLSACVLDADVPM